MESKDKMFNVLQKAISSAEQNTIKVATDAFLIGRDVGKASERERITGILKERLPDSYQELEALINS